ncbi:ferritin-like domain-containing protein [Nonomuraea sp. NPDC050643]|uniref:ferritin-like domain-containing protein n=1 Tax=Nonomuraea sp. NPDC050643 TaxID=3155660 RepID=UPI0033C35853
MLNDVIATEVVCRLRYTRHAISAKGIDRAQVAEEFTEHAKEELDHALRAAERVSRLGGEPDFDPAKLVQRSHTDDQVPADTDRPARAAGGEPVRRAHRHLHLPGDHPLAGRRRPDHPAAHGVDPGGGGARRRPDRPARSLGPALARG